MSSVASGESGFEELPLETLRARRSAKWTTYPPDVLPAFVAETDFALAPPLRSALAEALARGDTGYPSAGGLAEAFSGFARARWDWEPDPAGTFPVSDVVTAVTELLRALGRPGDGVVLNPPVYPPFYAILAELGRAVVEAPLRLGQRGYELDLDVLERAFREGARAYVLCHPHNPTGRSLGEAELVEVASLAARYGVFVVSDEVHAPLTLPGARHLPFLAVSEEARATGVAIVSASKAWNVPGLKCALVVSGSDAVHERVRAALPARLAYQLGHFGVIAALAAFAHGGPWLDALLERLDANRRALGSMLAELLPEVGYFPPEAGYLAWLDFRAFGLGDDPSAALLEHGRVALSAGPGFGTGGQGFARLNFGTSEVLLGEALRRVEAGVRAAAVQLG